MEWRISVKTLPSASCSNAETRFDGLKELIQATKDACSCFDILKAIVVSPGLQHAIHFVLLLSGRCGQWDPLCARAIPAGGAPLFTAVMPGSCCVRV